MWRAPPWGPSEERMRAMSRSLSRRRARRRSPNARGSGNGGARGGRGGRGSLHNLRRRGQHSRRRNKGRRPHSLRRTRSNHHRGSRNGKGAKGSQRRARGGKARRNSLRRRATRGSSRRRGKSRHKSSGRRYMKSYSSRSVPISSTRSSPSVARSVSRHPQGRGSSRRLSPHRSGSPGRGSSPLRPVSSGNGRNASPRRLASMHRTTSPRRHYLHRGRSPRRRHLRHRRSLSYLRRSASGSKSQSRDSTPKRSSTPPRANTAGTSVSDKDSSSASTDKGKSKEGSKGLLKSSNSVPTLLFRPVRRQINERPGSPITAVASLQALVNAQKRASRTVIVPAKSATQLPLVALPQPPPPRPHQLPTPPSSTPHLIPHQPPPPPGQKPLPGAPGTQGPSGQGLPPIQGPADGQSASAPDGAGKQGPQSSSQPSGGDQQQSTNQHSSTSVPKRCPPCDGPPPPVQPPVPTRPCYPPPARSQAAFPHSPIMASTPNPLRAESPPAQKARNCEGGLLPSSVPKGFMSRLLQKGSSSQTAVGDGPPASYFPDDAQASRNPYGAKMPPRPYTPQIQILQQQRPAAPSPPVGFYYGAALPPQVSPEALAAAKAHAARVAAIRADALRKIADVEREREIDTPTTPSSKSSQQLARQTAQAVSQSQSVAYQRPRLLRQEMPPGPNCIPEGNPNSSERVPVANFGGAPPSSTQLYPELISTAQLQHPDHPSTERVRPSSHRPSYPAHLLSTSHPLYAMAVASSWSVDHGPQRPHVPHQLRIHPSHIQHLQLPANQRHPQQSSSQSPIEISPSIPNVRDFSPSPQAPYSQYTRPRHQSQHHLAASQPSINLSRMVSPPRRSPAPKGELPKIQPGELMAYAEDPETESQRTILLRPTSGRPLITEVNDNPTGYSGDFRNNQDKDKSSKDTPQNEERAQVMGSKNLVPWQKWALPAEVVANTMYGNVNMRQLSAFPGQRSMRAAAASKDAGVTSGAGHWLPTPAQSPSTHRLSPVRTTVDSQKKGKESTPGGGDTLWRTYYYEEKLFTPTIPLPKHHEL